MINLKLNLTKEEAYEIANEYIDKYGFTKHSFNNIEKSVNFYPNFYNVDGPAWTVAVEYPALFPGETDETTYVISDKNKKVEYVIGPDGVPITYHLSNELDCDEENDEWDLVDD